MATCQLSKLINHVHKTMLRQEAARLSDGQLLECYVRGREDAIFDAIVRRHGPMVMGICRRILRNRHDAEDAFQATFLVLVRKAASIASRQLLGNWLYGVAHNTALKARAAIARRRRREAQVSELPESEAVPQEVWNDLLPVLDAELSRLPEKYRVCIVLCELEGKTGKQAARQLGWPEGTLSGRLSRARALLAKRLTQRGVALGGGTLAALLAENAASASVPISLVHSTVKAATLVAAGQSLAAAAVSAKVAKLTEGVLRAMLLAKLKMVTVGLVVFAVMGVGAVQVPFRAAEAGQAKANVPEPQNKSPIIPESKDDSDLEVVEKLLIARRDHQRALELLRAHYVKSGNQEKAKWAEEEIREFHRANHHAYRLDLDVPPPTLRAAANIHEANKLIARAKDFKDKGTGIILIDNQRRAELLLKQLLTQFPTSDKIGEAAYLLGDLYESDAFKHYHRAAVYFERSVQWDPTNKRDAPERAAKLYRMLRLEPPIPKSELSKAEESATIVEKLLFSVLEKEHSINFPGLEYTLQIKSLRGRTLVDPVFTRRDGDKQTTSVTVRATEAELIVDLANKRIIFEMKDCIVSSPLDGTEGIFDNKVWPVPLPPEFLDAAGGSHGTGQEASRRRVLFRQADYLFDERLEEAFKRYAKLFDEFRDEPEALWACYRLHRCWQQALNAKDPNAKLMGEAVDANIQFCVQHLDNYERGGAFRTPEERETWQGFLKQWRDEMKKARN
jgi:RNA polymerase sigma factor (sigma-70 family)